VGARAVSDDWLEIPDEDINVAEIMRNVRERIERRSGEVGPAQLEPSSVADALWKEMVDDGDGVPGEEGAAAIRQLDCDVVPRHYRIEWRLPIVGPVHAVVRKLINAEIRRYLMPSLERQSTLNRKVRRKLRQVEKENADLRRQIDELRGHLLNQE
jgi:hypothetical protein